MGIKDFWRKHKNKQIAKKDEKLARALQDIVDHAPVAFVEVRGQPVDPQIYDRLNAVEEQLVTIQSINPDSWRERAQIAGSSRTPSPSLRELFDFPSSPPIPESDRLNGRRAESRLDDYHDAYEQLDDRPRSSNRSINSPIRLSPEVPRESPSEARILDQLIKDEDFARRLQLEEDQVLRTTRRKAQLADDQIGNGEEQQERERQIAQDEELAWKLLLANDSDGGGEDEEEISLKESTTQTEEPIIDSPAPRTPSPAIYENLPIVNRTAPPEFVSRALEFQRRRLEQPIIAGRPRIGFTSQIESDAALARSLQQAETDFYEQNFGAQRASRIEETNERVENIVGLLPLFVREDELDEESEEEELEPRQEEIIDNDQDDQKESHCVICFEDRAQDPVGCAHCKQLIGCRRCVLTWYRGGNADDLNTAMWFIMVGDQNYKKCPLCRHQWLTQPDLISM